MTDAAIIVCALLGSALGAAAFAWAMLRYGNAYDKDMGLEAEDKE